MKILCSKLYEKQLKEILLSIASSDYNKAKNFKLYLDTIVLNAHTKARKYKQSVYSDNEDIKDIEHEGYTIPFLLDEPNDTYLMLAIYAK
ncbi:MAG: type II toxin-antitoxin system RelE/ParE family toxin [Sulfurimonas sp.]